MRLEKDNNKKLDIPELHQKQNVFGKISGFFIERYKLVYLFMIALLLMGVVTYNGMPKETMPDVSLNMVVVYTVFPGGSVEDVEKLITDPLEDSFGSVDNIANITSDTKNGISQIIIEFDDDTDMTQAESEINNEVVSFNLPKGAMEPIVMEIETGEMPLMTLTVTGDYDLIALKQYAENIQDEIEGIDGVRNVDVVGGYEREIQVNLDFNKMTKYGVNASTIQNALQYSNINMPAGAQNIDGEKINIRVDESFKSVEEIENLVVISNAQSTVFLKDVAEVKDGFKEVSNFAYMYSDITSKEQNVTPTISITAYRETGYDVIVPCEEIRTIVEDENSGLFPSDLVIDITSDQSTEVGDTLSDVLNNALGGLIVVMIVLYIFIGLNEALIVSSVIPLSLLATLLLMNASGITLNSISLTGFIIALGLLVDNAIVVMENVDRLRDKKLDRITASRLGINQVGPAILTATLTTILAFVPVAMMPGLMGKFIGVMPKTVIFIIAASLVVSVIVTPTLCSKFLTSLKKKEEIEAKTEGKSKKARLIPGVVIFILALIAFMNDWKIEVTTVIAAIGFVGIYIAKDSLTNKTKEAGGRGYIEKYGDILYKLLGNTKKKVLLYVMVIVVLIGSVATIPMGILQLELLPPEDPTMFKIEIETPKGTLISDTQKSAFEIEKLLYEIEDIESFTITVGDGGENLGLITAELYDEDLRERTGNQVIALIKEELKIIPGIETKVSFTSSMGKMSGGAPVGIGLKGTDIEELDFYADQYLEVLKTIEGVEDPENTVDGGLNEIVIDIDNNKAAYYGLNVSQVSNEIRQQIAGAKVGIYKENSEEYDISIYYSDEKITSIEDFDKIFFQNYQGQLVNFNDVAKIEYKEGLGIIQHDNGKKIVSINSEVKDGYNANAIMSEFIKQTADIQVPKHITVEKVGESKELNTQMANLLQSFMIAILLVYIVLVFQFNSFTQPLVILLSVPFALIGVVWGLILTGNNLGFFAMFGVVALVGIAVNEAIVLIDFANYNRKNGTEIKEAIVEAVKIRIMPVLATTLTTMGGVLPLALYNDMFTQLGYALIFGLMVSVALTLVILPIIYYALDGFTIKIGKKLRKVNRL